MADPRRLFARRRRSRRFRIVRRILVAAAMLAVVGGTVWLVYFSTVLAAGSVRVEGVDRLPQQQIIDAADLPMGEPMVRLDVGAAESRIEKIPAVQSAEISRDWPTSLVISVTERTPVALVVDANGVRGVDSEGVLFKLRGRQPHLPTLVMDDTAEASALSEAVHVIMAMPRRLSDKVAEVRAKTMDSITLQLHDGDTVVWGSADDSAAKAEALALILPRKASVYDVSVPDLPTTTS
jgi:cell division protein FtsQ